MFGYTIIKTSELEKARHDAGLFERMADGFRRERDEYKRKVEIMTSGLRQNRKREGLAE